MTKRPNGQVTGSAAQTYDEFFVPALFQEWAVRVADLMPLAAGQHVLDVACGTGALTREVLRRVIPGGSVVGLDCNEGMLAVARHNMPNIDWRRGMAESLPFPNCAFDAVVCQFGLTFFDGRIEALKEMWRVTRPGGQVTIAVWDSLDNTPGYAAMTNLLGRLFGTYISNELQASFTLGDTDLLRSLLEQAGMRDADVVTYDGVARFPSIEAWVHSDVKGWTFADSIDDAQYQRLLREAKNELLPYIQGDGRVAFRSPAHIATIKK